VTLVIQPQATRKPPSPPHWGALLLVWTLAGLISLVSGYVQYRHEGLPVPWSRLWSEVVGWGLWVVLFPVMVLGAWAGGRAFHGLASERLYRNVALTILFATGLFGLLRGWLF